MSDQEAQCEDHDGCASEDNWSERTLHLKHYFAQVVTAEREYRGPQHAAGCIGEHE
jgi:hypothetical protein